MLLNTYRAKRRVIPGLVGAAFIVLAAVALSVLLAPLGGASAATLEEQCANDGAVTPYLGQSYGAAWLTESCAALLSAKDELAGTATLNWATDRNIADWDGIRVEGSDDHHNQAIVAHLILPNWGLDGSIPQELGSIKGMYLLHLENNQLTGSIPKELGQLDTSTGPGLADLKLQNNRLTGKIPQELGNLRNLSVLDLSHNRLTGKIPSVLGGLPRLGYVYLGHNRLRGPVPSELGNLSGLTELRLDHNRLTGSIPKELATPIFLQILALNDNRLSGAIPEELGKRTVNNSTSSHWNVWTESFWTYHHGLKELRLHNNQLNGCIPEAIRFLSLTSPPVGELPGSLGLPWCGDTPSPAILQQHCETEGAVPNADDNPGLVKDCVALLAAKNELAGTASLKWDPRTALADWDGIKLEGTPSRVARINLAGQELNGEIPGKQLRKLSGLVRLNLSRNKLSGPIPQQLGRLANLNRLQLHGNELEGEIPRQLGKLSNLELLRLDSNDLTGCIPEAIRELPLGEKAMGKLSDDLGLPWCGK